MTREHPCCLCPALESDFKNNVCADCGFIKKYTDERGWIYFVRGGIGGVHKTFYRKPGNNKEKACSIFPWHQTFVQAQIDLNKTAKARGWQVV
ncbi:hypothetical protein BR63_19035 [Thermanaerosceptrum fracticalcis]|uniref:Uncharacterized protein n=1 Tax=Thermanaerosceptrum fracticalcis TaxID=1712410 RepID=A0A7G6E7X4_THEFR|nr:hypothetical protein [Thermanaerosceptrum fracticalcis]QNB48178.1 hypothetical protein BR63_19035 [Thermanaerosceptrum fracticalcis]